MQCTRTAVSSPFDIGCIDIEQKILLALARQDVIVAFVREHKIKIYSKIWPGNCITLYTKGGQIPPLDSSIWHKMVSQDGAIIVWVNLASLNYIGSERIDGLFRLILKCHDLRFAFDHTTFGDQVTMQYAGLVNARHQYQARVESMISKMNDALIIDVLTQLSA